MKKLTLPDCSQARVLVVGDVMLDRYWFGDVQRISPEAPVPIVHVQQLLLTADHAQLYRGRQLRILMEQGLDVLLLEQFRQRPSGFIVTHHRQHRCLTAQGSHITRHVGRTARALFGTLHMHDRHRRFG